MINLTVHTNDQIDMDDLETVLHEAGYDVWSISVEPPISEPLYLKEG